MALLVFAMATMGLPTLAGAATVTAFEQPLFKSPGERYSATGVEAEPEEANRLTITLAGEPGSFLFQVRDDAEPLVAGFGCQGGGAPGAVVSCPLTVAPGTVTVALGNRGSTLDAASFPGRFVVRGGSGDDTVTTGEGSDQFFPHRCGPNFAPSSNCDPGLGDGTTGADRVMTGGGQDSIWLGDGPSQVFAGSGNDWVLATAVPNGPDTIDLGEGEQDIASFYTRQTAFSYTADELANDGAPGEGDLIFDAEVVAGGHGDDRLTGDGGGDYLVGGGGTDLLIGLGGNDWLFGETGGGSRLNAIDGFSLAAFRYDYEKMRRLRIAPGADKALGGSGNDHLHLDGGNDRGVGGLGDDRIHGNTGNDRLIGGPGRDRINGGPQHDRCRASDWGSVFRHCERLNR